MRRIILRVAAMWGVTLLALGAPADPASAAGRAPYGGRVNVVVDGFEAILQPYLARGEDGRFVASLVHSGLFRGGGEGVPRPELVEDGGVVDGGSLILRLRAGLRFHDGAPLGAEDVARSLQAVRRLGSRGPLWPLTRGLKAVVVDARTVRIPLPRGADVVALRRLLARPELAILRGGREGQGRSCGPFVPTNRVGAEQHLAPFEGHARGRPWLAEVTLQVGISVEGEVERMVFGRLGLTLTASPRLAKADCLKDVLAATIMAVPAGPWQAPHAQALRLAVAARVRDLRLDLQVDAPVRLARSIWPAPVWPDAPALPSATGSLSPVPTLTIAYPAGDLTLRDVAFGLRDSLRWLVRSEPRALAVPGLDVAVAVTADGQAWDLAVVRHVWVGRSPGEVAVESAWLAGVAPPTARDAWRGSVKGLARDLVDGAGVIPLLHERVDVCHEAGLWLAPSTSVPVDLSASYRQKR